MLVEQTVPTRFIRLFPIVTRLSLRLSIYPFIVECHQSVSQSIIHFEKEKTIL